MPAVLAPVLLLFFSCGIPDYPYLEPPEIARGSEAQGLLSYFPFPNAYLNNPNYFIGYVFYYRLFSNEPALTSNVSSLSSASSPASLTNNGYRIMAKISGTAGFADPPTITLAQAIRDSGFFITFDLSGDWNEVQTSPASYDSAVTWTYGGGGNIPIGREVQQRDSASHQLTNNFVTRSFKRDDFHDTDSDVPADLAAGATTIYMAVFVASYGIDANATPLYSSPVYLGRFDIPVVYQTG